MLRRCRLGWVLSAGLAAAAVQPLPAQVTITPGNSVNLDSVARPQNSSGQTTTFAVQYFASTSGIDRKFRFSCIGTNGITGVVCPLTKTLTSNAAATTIPVTFNTGAAGTGTLTIRVDQTLPSGPLTATGRRDFTITAPSASLVVLAPTAANMYRGVGATPTEAFTLKNIGPASTTYTLAVAPGSCGGVLTACSVSPTNVTLAPTVTQTISVPYTVSAAGVQALGVQASAGGNVVATGSSTINVLSAAMAPTSASIPVTTSASAQSYGGFTLVNAANSPAMTVQLTASCTGVLSSCVLTSSNASTDSVSLGAGGAPAISIKFVAATVGMGTFTISASSKGVTLGGASLTVTASAPTSNVSVTLDPPQRTVNAVAGSATLTYAGFNLSNDANSPATTIGASRRGTTFSALSHHVYPRSQQSLAGAGPLPVWARI